LLLTVCLALFMPIAALAQDPGAQISKDDYRDYVALYYGVNFGGDLFEGGPFEGFDSGNPKALGVAVGFWGKGMLSGELDFCYNPEFFGPKDELESDSNLLTLTASFVINPSIDIGSQRIRPYFLIGGGLMRATIDEFAVLGKSTTNKGVVNLGGGVQYYFHPRVGVRGDLRYFRGVGSTDEDEDGWGWIPNWNYFRATAGVAFTF
jgi:opacity protein-like surface antigen